MLAAPTGLANLIFPHVLLWNPLVQFQCIITERLPCPRDHCKGTLIVQAARWNIGSNAGNCPRIIHDTEHMVLLVPAVYACSCGHEVLATDPRLLLCLPEQEYVPFILFHRSGVMRNFARLIITLTVQGLSFNAIEESIKSHRAEHIASLQLKLNCILPQSDVTPVKDDESICHIHKPYPSNDLICNCFLKIFAENRRIYFQDMASLSTINYITIDHTFKVAANVGYLRPDGRWITQYNSLFIVLNNIGQVIAWQFTKTTSLDECIDLLSALKERLQNSGAQLTELYVDNCCITRQKLQGILGPHVQVRLDLFHATQRITKAIRKRHPLCKQIMKDVKLLFRNPRDKGQQRTLPTPTVDILLKNFEFFITKWKDAQVADGQHILNDQVLKELKSLKVHISRGCLSDINLGCGTNRNENLHRSINPFFSRCRMGIPLALALLTVLFHRHNQKLSSGTGASIISARARCPHGYNFFGEDNACFGIIKKTENTDIDSWIFGSQIQSIPQLPTGEIAEFMVGPELDDIVTSQDIITLLETSVNLVELAKTLQKQTRSSTALNQKMIPFMSSVSCLFESVNVSNDDTQEHYKRLVDIINSWGFRLHPVEGDGNCCFCALAMSIIFQQNEILTLVPTLLSDLNIEANISVDELACELRRIAVEEWCNAPEEYQGFIGDAFNVKEEAEKFKQQGHFFGPLGNTMVPAVSNALGLQVVIFSSAHHYPLIHITPRVCKVAVPLYVAFNQANAGHYDAVTVSDMSNTSLQGSHFSPPLMDNKRCTCGQKGKHYSTTERCIPVKKRYTSVSLCPCLANSQPCTSACICNNCSNPNGVKPNTNSARPKQRQRYKHVWQQTPPKSSSFAALLQEDVTRGPCTQFEYILISQIVKHLCLKRIDPDVDVIHVIYTACTDLVSAFKMSWPLGSKNEEEVNTILQEHDKNRKVFEAVCVTQLKINAQQSTP